MRRLCQLYGGKLQRKLRCRIYLQRTKLHCRIYMHQTCTNSVALQNFLQRSCTNSRHVAEIICNAICVAEKYLQRTGTTSNWDADLSEIFYKKTATVSSDSQYNLYSTI